MAKQIVNSARVVLLLEVRMGVVGGGGGVTG